MAPEVMNCSQATTSSDMWSVGAVAYTLLSGGKSPFYCGSRYRTMARSLSCQYDLAIPELEHISPQAKDLVTKLLVKDNTKRYAVLLSLFMRYPVFSCIVFASLICQYKDKM